MCMLYRNAMNYNMLPQGGSGVMPNAQVFLLELRT